MIALTGNQSNLLNDVIAYLKDPHYHEYINDNYDKGHGRIEQRTAVVCHQIEWLTQTHQWPGLASIGKITSNVTRKGKQTIDTRYYISSLKLQAHQLNEIARAHWAIENQLHWSLDVVFNEDKACIRNDNAAENIDVIRKWALAVLTKAKDKPEQSVKSLMRKNLMSHKHLIKIVNRIFHA